MLLHENGKKPSVHKVSPAPENLPVGQSEHGAAPLTEKVPGSHGLAQIICSVADMMKHLSNRGTAGP